MTVTIVEAGKIKQDFDIIMTLMQTHPEPEYDCTFEEYKEVFRNLYQSPQVRAWVAFTSGNAVGYVIARRQYLPKNQIDAIQIYLLEPERNKGIARMLIEKIVEWAIDNRAKRIEWGSRYGVKIWERINRSLCEKYKTTITNQYLVRMEVP